MIKVRIDGIDEALLRLQGFSDRRLRATLATALTRTAGQVRAEWRVELQQHVDKPTPLTLGGPVTRMATAQTLQAEVLMREGVANGQPPAEYLRPLEYGGGRTLKRFERALIASGAMPAGHYAVPTDAARRDAYGNVARQQIVQVLAQLAGGHVSAGYRRVISASAARRAQAAIRAGRQYVAALQTEGKRAAGIYERTADGGLRMVFAYERQVSYRRQLSLMTRAERTAQQVFDAEFKRAAADSLRRLKAR